MLWRGMGFLPGPDFKKKAHGKTGGTMRGIETAFEGVVYNDAELRTAQSGREWLSFAVRVGEEPKAEFVRVAAFHGGLTDLQNELRKGGSVYVEGKLSLRGGSGLDNASKAYLNVVASTIQPLYQIGNKRPKKTPSRGKPKKSASADPYAPIPFSDELPF
jgi:single-stranded DNA-binding protein